MPEGLQRPNVISLQNSSGSDRPTFLKNSLILGRAPILQRESRRHLGELTYRETRVAALKFKEERNSNR